MCYLIELLGVSYTEVKYKKEFNLAAEGTKQRCVSARNLNFCCASSNTNI